MARPDLVTPGVAYSTVPRWDAGEEVNQGTSMAAPHAAGIAALLVSALTQEKRPVVARGIRQALMVTAQPTPGATIIDEGTGIPDVDRAYRWLTSGTPVADVQVRALGAGNATAAVLRGRDGAADTTQGFELRRPAGAPAATYTLRSDVPWLTAPATLALRGERGTVQLRVARRSLPVDAASMGTVTGWTGDTLAGPAFRLVTTVIAAAPVAHGTKTLRENAAVPAGGALRTFFQADSGRAFALTIETAGRAERALAFLHEPDGMPFRDEGARSAGFGPQSAEYEADSRDVISGAYEAVVVAPPTQGVTVSVAVSESPLVLRAAREGESVHAEVTNVTAAPVDAEFGMHLGGAARIENVQVDGRRAQRIPFVVPSWSRGVVVDLTMDRAQWGRFTDFGVSLFDSLGRQLGKQPLNYAFGRLQVELPEGHGDMPVTLGLFPGFADPKGDQRWSLRASIRVYADTSIVLARSDKRRRHRRRPRQHRAAFKLPAAPWPLAPGFVPLGLLVARADGRSWTREVELAPPARRSSRERRRRGAVRIAAGQGFWGDWLEAPVRQVRGGPIDYLMMDYLAEVTMSIMQKQKSRDPTAGYARDFVPLMERILPDIVAKGIRVTSNAGGVNPRACAEAVLDVARRLGLAAAGCKVGLVSGDDILDRLDDLIARGHALPTWRPVGRSRTFATRCSPPTRTSAWRRSSRRSAAARTWSSPGA